MDTEDAAAPISPAEVEAKIDAEATAAAAPLGPSMARMYRALSNQTNRPLFRLEVGSEAEVCYPAGAGNS